MQSYLGGARQADEERYRIGCSFKSDDPEISYANFVENIGEQDNIEDFKTDDVNEKFRVTWTRKDWYYKTHATWHSGSAVELMYAPGNQRLRYRSGN